MHGSRSQSPAGSRLAARARTWLAPRLVWHYGHVVVLVAFLTVGVVQRTRAAFGILLVGMTAELGWTRALTAGATSPGALVRVLGAVPLGALFDRLGPRVVFSGATVMFGLGLALTAIARQPWQLYGGVGVLVGLGLDVLLLSPLTQRMTAQLALGSAVAPVLGGWVHDLTGTYALAPAAALCAVAAASGVWLAAPRRGLLDCTVAHVPGGLARPTTSTRGMGTR